jgi:hypothetical protein
MASLVKKLKFSTRRHVMTPHTTATSHSQPSKRAHNSDHRCDEDHTAAQPPTKRHLIANSKSNTLQWASTDNLYYDNVPDVPGTDLPALEQVWRQAKDMSLSKAVVSSHIFLSHRHICLAITLRRLLLSRR